MAAMKKEDCHWNFKWDSREDAAPLWFSRNRNKLLVINISQISSQIHKSTLSGGATNISISPYLLKLFESLTYFDSTNRILCNRYKVEINNEQDSNIVFVYRESNGIMPKFPASDLECGDIIFEKEDLFSPEEILNYHRKLSGYITILNHRKFDGIKIFSQRIKT